MDLETFQTLPVADVARIVRANGSKVCVFPINGTRRWFRLEHPVRPEDDFATEYRRLAAARHIELYQLLFEHGIDTLLTPIFGPDLLERGEAYGRMAIEGLAMLATDPAFLDFYQTWQVRVRFYGDYRKCFDSTPYAYLSDLFDEATTGTQFHDQYRLFFGVCAHDATETVAELAVQYHAEHGCIPSKLALVEMYYGELVEPVDLYIGFDKFNAYDMPLVATGNEDLYFSVCPSPYLSGRQLRNILFDHTCTRRGGEQDYSALEPADWSWMGDFYRANRDKTLGVGMQRGDTWYPLPQVWLPSSSA